MPRFRLLPPLLAALLAGVVGTHACSNPDASTELQDGDAPTPIVDSIFPPEEQIRRFQGTVADTPTSLAGASSSRDELVERFLVAAERRSADSLLALAATKGEFAFFYHPHSRFAVPPYQLAPDVLWFQIRNSHSRGVTRLLRQLEKRAIEALGYTCEERPLESGPIRIWEECLMLLPGEAGDTVQLRLFGSILEYGGRFKFLSLSNDL